VLFLLNDRLVDLGTALAAPPDIAGRVAAMGPLDVIGLVREVFAADPNFLHTRPGAANKAALMLILKAPELNAALFMAPEAGCHPALVTARFAAVDPHVLHEFKALQDEGRLTFAAINIEIWSKVQTRAA
jgi:hypothetical protein